jgi:WD40 repeat protein
VTGKCEAEPKGHSSSITSVVLSSNGTYTSSTTHDKSLQMNVVVTWSECEAELRGHPGLIILVAFSPDGTCVVSTSDNKSLQLWNLMTGDFGVFGDHIALFNGIQICCYNDGSVHFSHSQGDQLTPVPLLDIDGSCICHRNTGQCCWIPPHLSHHTAVVYSVSQVCSGLDMGDVLVVKVGHFYLITCYKSHKQTLKASPTS